MNSNNRIAATLYSIRDIDCLRTISINTLYKGDDDDDNDDNNNNNNNNAKCANISKIANAKYMGNGITSTIKFNHSTAAKLCSIETCFVPLM